MIRYYLPNVIKWSYSIKVDFVMFKLFLYYFYLLLNKTEPIYCLYKINAT